MVVVADHGGWIAAADRQVRVACVNAGESGANRLRVVLTHLIQGEGITPQLRIGCGTGPRGRGRDSPDGVLAAPDLGHLPPLPLLRLLPFVLHVLIAAAAPRPPSPPFTRAGGLPDDDAAGLCAAGE